MDTPTPGAPLAAARSSRRSTLTWLMLIFAVPVPVGVVLAFMPQLMAIGEVSHWPWDDYGFFGWWLVPLSLAVAAGIGAARPEGARTRGVWVISIVAILTTVALFFNP